MFSFTQKYTPGIVADDRGAKTMIRFSLGQDPCKNRSYAAGGARYLQADLMLLTHAKYAHKDPRGRFGISTPRCRSLGIEIRFLTVVSEIQTPDVQPFFRKAESKYHRFAPLRCAGIASAGLPLSTQEEQGPLFLYAAFRGKKLTCTGRPDGSGARSDRLQLPGCERTAPLHAPGTHESDGCNGSRLPAVPDTSRCPQPWRSE